MVSDLIKDSRFVLVFVGEAPYSGVFKGWEALLAEIRVQYTVNDDEHKELLERLEEGDNWTMDDMRVPFEYWEETGEIGSMSIFRITDERNA